MDKSVGRDKRRLDKHHKKPPPVKPSSGGPTKKPQKEPAAAPPPTAPLIVCDDHFSRRPIESNWNSSKNLPSSPEGSDSEDEQLRAADFEKLLQMPPSASGHFFLSTEKHWVSESEEGVLAGGKGQQFGQYFQIDTKQLTASLATIPFYERNDYPTEIFSKNELDSMKLKAQLESKKYDELCQRRLESGASGKMGDKPKPPVKCLIGAGALPPPLGRDQQSLERQPPPPQPMPCLVGPMALPPELRNDPNVTGSYASAARVTERLGEVSLAEGGRRGTTATTTSGDSVPIRNDNEHQAEEAALSGKQKMDQGSSEEQSKPTGKETKEDIQQWLDDILDM